MIIAKRFLKLRASDIVAISLHSPEQEKPDWVCRFEIDWPEGAATRWASGIDAIQALIHALQMIGAEIYTSTHFEQGELSWLEGYEGCGFPVPHNIRDVLIGDDAKFL